VFKDYIDFTIDLKNDRGKIYVGSYEEHIVKIKKPEMVKQYKPVTTFLMRDKQFVDLMAGELRPVKAIQSGAIKIQGNLFAVRKFQSNFLMKYGW